MKRSQGEGSIKEYKPGKWYARIRIKGKEHNFYGTSELEVTEKLAAFKKTLLQDSLVVPQEAKQPMNDNAGAVLPVEASDNLITVTELQKILKIGKDTAYTLVRSFAESKTNMKPCCKNTNRGL